MRQRTKQRSPQRQPENRRAELAMIHMGAQALKLIDGSDDSAYRDMLFTVARVRSSKDLDHAGRQRVLDHLRSRGWSATRSVTRPIRRQADLSASEQCKLIQHLWACLHQAGVVRDGSAGALRAYVRNQTRAFAQPGATYDAPELLPVEVAQRLIEQMKRWAKRSKVDWR